jgi:hypothetical protein
MGGVRVSEEPNDGNPVEVWITAGVLNWPLAGEGSSPLDSPLGAQATGEWDHAALRLDPRSTDQPLDRKDAISALSRAVERRIQLFHTVYGVDAPDPRRPTQPAIPGMTTRDRLDQLRELGLARGLVLTQLRKLRNKTEHESAEPPSREECHLYLDAVWYFLRSTERFARRKVEEFDLSDDTAGGEVTITVRPPEWTAIQLTGHLPGSAVSRSPMDGFIPVEIAVSSDVGSLFRERSDGSFQVTGFITEPRWQLAVAIKYFTLS